MSRKASSEIFTYRPYAWVRIAVGLAFLVFVAVTVIAIKADLKPLYVALSAAMAIFAALGVVESFVSRVDVGPDAVAIKGLIKTERVVLSQVKKISADGGRIGLYMETGK